VLLPETRRNGHYSLLTTRSTGNRFPCASESSHARAHSPHIYTALSWRAPRQAGHGRIFRFAVASRRATRRRIRRGRPWKMEQRRAGTMPFEFVMIRWSTSLSPGMDHRRRLEQCGRQKQTCRCRGISPDVVVRLPGPGAGCPNPTRPQLLLPTQGIDRVSAGAVLRPAFVWSRVLGRPALGHAAQHIAWAQEQQKRERIDASSMLRCKRRYVQHPRCFCCVSLREQMFVIPNPWKQSIQEKYS
jgi:hypothetical protein